MTPREAAIGSPSRIASRYSARLGADQRSRKAQAAVSRRTPVGLARRVDLDDTALDGQRRLPHARAPADDTHSEW